MKLNKKQEVKLRNSAKLIRETLNSMTFDQSADFVLHSADGKTLRQLEALRLSICGWGFKRSF